MDYLVADSEDFEMEESESGEIRDRLSELPDSLILLILSLLSMSDVVRTTVLSKRWKDLWTTVPCLDFSDDRDHSYRFRGFVNRALTLWKGAKIVKFKINFSFDSSYRDVDSWVRFAVENVVEELDISLMDVRDVMLGYDDPGYLAPQCLYSCSSIRKLSLLACNLEINGNVHWNQLKSLRIDGVRLSEDVINKVLSGAPQLEILMLRFMESYENLNIESSSLKKLTVEKYLCSPGDPAKETMLRIWAPNLATLEFAGVLYSKCLLINVSSLTDVNLDFDVPNYYDDDFPWNELLRKILRQIFPTIHHVEKLALSDWCIEVLGVMEKKYLLSSSSDVKFLKLNASFFELEEMMVLLEIFPKLKMFVIEHTDHILKEVNCKTFREKLFYAEQNYMELETNPPKSFLLQLRTVEITWFLDDASIFPFLEFLLKHASMLEKMVIRGRRIRSLATESLFLAAAQKLLSLQRSFPNVELLLCEK